MEIIPEYRNQVQYKPSQHGPDSLPIGRAGLPGSLPADRGLPIGFLLAALGTGRMEQARILILDLSPFGDVGLAFRGLLESSFHRFAQSRHGVVRSGGDEICSKEDYRGH